jgi:hypothetical protein
LKTWVGRVFVRKAEVLRAKLGALVERRLGAWPYAPQFAQEKLDGHRPQAGQRIQRVPQSGVGDEQSADHGDGAAVTLVDHFGQGLQPLPRLWRP